MLEDGNAVSYASKYRVHLDYRCARLDLGPCPPHYVGFRGSLRDAAIYVNTYLPIWQLYYF
jgi:hypothetical protein